MYDGCSDNAVPLIGECHDYHGRPYGYVSKMITRVYDCEHWCASLPNAEHQVGYHFGRETEDIWGGCFCHYDYGHLPGPIKDAFTSDPLPGSGPVGVGSGKVGYMCFPRSSSLSPSEALKTCDETMDLLLGQTLSLGTLREIVQDLKNNGPDYMPGSCCLDTPADSSQFGYDVSIFCILLYCSLIILTLSSQYDQTQNMTCKNHGHWYYGISREACENIVGIWTRNPCHSLKQCIDDRPVNGTEEYSQSFEDFALTIVIDDAYNEDECRSARSGLSFDADYQFDTDICDEFHREMCDPSYAEQDEMVDGLSSTSTTPAL